MTSRIAVCVGGLALIALGTPGTASSQGLDGHTANRLAASAASPTGADPASRFGHDLTAAETGSLLREIRDLAEEALRVSRAAEGAGSVDEVKGAADQVFASVWGHPSGLGSEGAAEVEALGWKERWQVSGAEFDTAFVSRLGSRPPEITDPRELGIAGRGRAVRGRLTQIATVAEKGSPRRTAAESAIAALNNVIGWTYVTIGFKGREVQPRISLTHVWDAPPAFWNSTADTGWLFEVHAQATNILKTDYAGNVDEARSHAADMSALLRKVIEGVDADRSGVVEAIALEGGIGAAIAEAARAGIAIPTAATAMPTGGSR